MKKTKLFHEFSKDIINNLIKEHKEKKGKSDKVEGIIDLVIKRNLVTLGEEKDQQGKEKYTIEELIS